MTDQRYTRDTIARAEQVVTRVRGISSCRISSDEAGEITEVHVVATARKSPKLVARDVETALKAELGISVDYKKIGVVLFEPSEEGAVEGEETMGESQEERTRPAHEAIVEFPVEEFPARFVFQSVNVFRSEDSLQAEVELVRSSIETFGSAKSENVSNPPGRLVAEATLKAIGELLDESLRLCLSDVVEVALGDDIAVVVKVDLIKARQAKSLVGCSLYAGDANQTVVFATLDAVNRVLGVLGTRSSVEYRIK